MEILGTYLLYRSRMECVGSTTDVRWENMSIADGMQHIVEDINESRKGRISEIAGLNKEVGEIRTDARKSLKTFNSARKHDAIDMRRTLRKVIKDNKKVVKVLELESQNMLDGFYGTRMEMARKTQDTLGDFTAKLKKDVANIRLDARNMVKEFADERVSQAIELSRMLKTYTDGIMHDVQLWMGDFEKQRLAVQKDLAEANEVWQSHMRSEHMGVGPGLKTSPKVIKGTKKETKKTEHASDDDLKEKVLKVIRDSPKGISLAKAGKKLDVEWRKLIRPAKELFEKGEIRKKDVYYFPS